MIRNFFKTIILCCLFFIPQVLLADDEMMEDEISSDTSQEIEDEAYNEEDFQNEESESSENEESEDLQDEEDLESEESEDSENEEDLGNEDIDPNYERQENPEGAPSEIIKDIVNETLGIEPAATSRLIDSHQVILDAENAEDLKQSQKLVKKISKIHEENQKDNKEIKEKISTLNRNLENLHKNFKGSRQGISKKSDPNKRYTIKKNYKNISSATAKNYNKINAIYVSKISQKTNKAQVYVIRNYNDIKSNGYSYPLKNLKKKDNYFISPGCRNCNVNKN